VVGKRLLRTEIGVSTGKVGNPRHWFQQDGAPARFKRAVGSNLDAAFRDCWFGIRLTTAIP
jgi:hypothetical protein